MRNRQTPSVLPSRLTAATGQSRPRHRQRLDLRIREALFRDRQRPGNGHVTTLWLPPALRLLNAARM
jgi:hypothetical protein